MYMYHKLRWLFTKSWSFISALFNTYTCLGKDIGLSLSDSFTRNDHTYNLQAIACQDAPCISYFELILNGLHFLFFIGYTTSFRSEQSYTFFKIFQKMFELWKSYPILDAPYRGGEGGGIMHLVVAIFFNSPNNPL